MPPLPDPESIRLAILPFLAPQVLLFLTFGLGALATAVTMVLYPNPVRSALFLVLNLFCVAVLYLLLNAYFLAVVQVIVYAGAIMVLFLFVIMLLNLGTPDRSKDVLRWQQPVAVVGGLVFALVLGLSVFSTRTLPVLDENGLAPERQKRTFNAAPQAASMLGMSPAGVGSAAGRDTETDTDGSAGGSPVGNGVSAAEGENEQVPTLASKIPVTEHGTVRGIGANLYDPTQPWLFPFEATSILLLVAVIGSVVLAKRRMPGESLAGSRTAEAGLATPDEIVPGGEA